MVMFSNQLCNITKNRDNYDHNAGTCFFKIPDQNLSNMKHCGMIQVLPSTYAAMLDYFQIFDT